MSISDPKKAIWVEVGPHGGLYKILPVISTYNIIFLVFSNVHLISTITLSGSAVSATYKTF